jgi:hypothetical protein
MYTEDSMISSAFIEENGNRQMETEMREVYEELRLRNIPVEIFTGKQMNRRQLTIKLDTLVVGYTQTILTALKILEVAAPDPNDYPAVLTPYFHRRIWESTVGELINHIAEAGSPLFAKPKSRKKRFAGQVFRVLTTFSIWKVHPAQR